MFDVETYAIIKKRIASAIGGSTSGSTINDAEISEAEVKTDSEIKTEEENTSTYNTGYAQWVEDDDDEE